MSLSELRCKDVVNKVMDLEFCPQDGRVQAIVVPGAFSALQLLRGERSGVVIPWELIERIGDDVILVCLKEAKN